MRLCLTDDTGILILRLFAVTKERCCMRTLDTSEQLDARQVWMELQLRESWHDDAQAASCVRTPRYYILQNGQVRETDFAAWAAWAYIRLPDRRIRHTLIGQVHVETWFLAFD
jgi:hypothetical protein